MRRRRLHAQAGRPAAVSAGPAPGAVRARRAGPLREVALAAGLATWLAAGLAWAQPSGNALVVGGATQPVVLGVSSTFDAVTVLDGGVLVVNAPLTVAGDLVIQAGGRLTLDAEAFGDGGLPVLQLSIDGGLVIEVGGAIDLSGQGLPPRTTIDPATSTPVPWAGSRTESSGASHLALGGGDAPPVRYDSPLAPRFPGGGGSLRGGGALVAHAAWARLDGLVRADGLDASICTPGPSAGGTISLTVGWLDGSGALSAVGGTYDLSYSCSPGGGAGGLIRLAYEESGFRGTYDVRGGSSRTAALAGRDGTASLVERATNGVRLAAGEFVLRGTEALPALSVAPGATLRLEGPAAVDQPVLVEPGARVVIASPRALERLALVPSVGGVVVIEADLEASVALTLLETATLVVNRRLVLDGLTAKTGATITHGPEVDTMHLVARRDIIVEEGARVDVSGLGLPAEVTIDPNGGQRVPGSDRSNGGSHGGRGGQVSADAGVAPIYDDPDAPRFPGGGGGTFSSTGTGGSGGGVARLTAARLRIDGAVTADGSKSLATPSAGSGAGGAVVIEAGQLEGSGSVRARGGDAPGLSGSGGAGGGGLVRIRAGEDAFTGEVSAAGGAGIFPGESGRIARDVSASLPPAIVSQAPSHAELGRAFDYAPVATGTPPQSWRIVSGPDGASIDGICGVVIWSPTLLGATSFTLEVSNPFGSARQTFSVEVVHGSSPDGGGVPGPRFLSTPNTSGQCDVPYHYAGVHAPRVEGTGPFSFSVHPLLGTELPRGLAVDPSTGAFAWTPTRGDMGTYPLELRVESPAGMGWQRFAIIVGCPAASARFASGCGCATTPPGAAVAFLAMSLAASAAARRRRLRPPRRPSSP